MYRTEGDSAKFLALLLAPRPPLFSGPSRTSPAPALIPVHVAKLQGQFNKGVHVLPTCSHRPSPGLCSVESEPPVASNKTTKFIS